MPVEIINEGNRQTTIYTPDIMDEHRVQCADYYKPFCIQGDWGNGPYEIRVVQVVKENDVDIVKFFDEVDHYEELGLILELIRDEKICAFEIHGIHP